MRYLLGLLVILVVADGLLTRFLVDGGLAREGNPLLQSFVGENGFIILKAVGALLCALILWDIYRRYPKLALISTLCFVVFYSGILVWNSSMFLLT